MTSFGDRDPAFPESAANGYNPWAHAHLQVRKEEWYALNGRI